MHDILRERLMRKIESLPEKQVYQTLDYIEFLESKYGTDATEETSGLRRFAEAMEDKLRKRSMSPAKLREAFQLISAADRVLSNVSSAGRKLMEELAPGPGEVTVEGEVPAVDEVTVEDELPAVDEVTVEDELPAVDEVTVEGELPAVDEVSVADELLAVDELSLVEEPPVGDGHPPVDELGADHDSRTEDPPAPG